MRKKLHVKIYNRVFNLQTLFSQCCCRYFKQTFSIVSKNNTNSFASILFLDYDLSETGRNIEANSNVNANLSPTISFWFRLNRIILRLCSTHQFKNLQVSKRNKEILNKSIKRTRKRWKYFSAKHFSQENRKVYLAWDESRIKFRLSYCRR